MKSRKEENNTEKLTERLSQDVSYEKLSDIRSQFKTVKHTLTGLVGIWDLAWGTYLTERSHEQITTVGDVNNILIPTILLGLIYIGDLWIPAKKLEIKKTNNSFYRPIKKQEGLSKNNIANLNNKNQKDTEKQTMVINNPIKTSNTQLPISGSIKSNPNKRNKETNEINVQPKLKKEEYVEPPKNKIVLEFSENFEKLMEDLNEVQRGEATKLIQKINSGNKQYRMKKLVDRGKVYRFKDSNSGIRMIAQLDEKGTFKVISFFDPRDEDLMYKRKKISKQIKNS